MKPYTKFVLSWLLLCAAPLIAQNGTDATRALATFDAARERSESERITPVRALARHATPEIDRVLLDEWQSATDPRYRQALIDALGSMRRGAGVLAVLTAVFEAEDAQYAEQSAAARGLTRQGDEGLAILLRHARTSGNEAVLRRARTSAIAALGAARSESAWLALASLLLEAESSERRLVLQQLEAAPGLDPVLAALSTAASDADLPVAANATRLLVDREAENARQAVTALASRAGRDSAAIARADLTRSYVAFLEPSLFEPFVAAAAGLDAAGLRSVAAVWPKAAANEAFVRWLRDRLPRRMALPEQLVAIRVLTHAKGSEITSLLADLVRGRQPELVHAALDAIAERGDPAAIPVLRKLLRGRDPRRVPVLLCLHALSKDDPGWHAELVGMLGGRERDPGMRAVLLDLLAELSSLEALQFAFDDFTHADWRVRAAAYDFCRKVRHAGSVPLLFARVDAESGRLREDVLDVLQSLTARRHPTSSQWRDWWASHGASFELVPAGAADPTSKSRSGDTVSYYGIPLVSERVVFVVDVSGSMSARIGTGGSRSRLDEAKRQLRRVVEATPKHFRFNIVSFHTTVTALLDQMTPAADKVRAEALGTIEALSPTGGTNVHDALERAFAEQDVDTIYLLTDGSPSAGPIQDPEQLADAVQRWNRVRQIRIHCVSIGADSSMLKRIAADSGGDYVMVR